MTHKHLTLTQRQKGELQRIVQTARGRRVLRARALLLLADGATFVSAGSAVGLDEQTVSFWCRRYGAKGITDLLDRPRSGPPRRLTNRAERHLAEVVRKAPRLEGYAESFWTCRLLAEHLEYRFHIALSDERVRQVLQSHGISFSRPKHRLVSPDPEYAGKKGAH